MNPTEEHPLDELETSASMAIGLSFLLGRALIDSDRHRDAGPGRHEKEGIEFLIIEVGNRPRQTTDRINEMTAAEFRSHADGMQKHEAELAERLSKQRAS